MMVTLSALYVQSDHFFFIVKYDNFDFFVWLEPIAKSLSH